MNPETTEPSAVLKDKDGDPITFVPIQGHLFVCVAQGEDHAATVGPFTPDTLIAAVRETAGITEPEVEDRFATGPRFTPDLRWCEGDDICGQANKGWGCTRTRGHDGEHVAHTNAYEVCHVWEDAPTQQEPCERHIRTIEDLQAVIRRRNTTIEELQARPAAPATAREAFDLAVRLCYEPEESVIPAGTPYVCVDDNGWATYRPGGAADELPSRGFAYRCLLLDPPTPKRPEGAEAIEATLIAEGIPADTARRAADRIARERATS